MTIADFIELADGQSVEIWDIDSYNSGRPNGGLLYDGEVDGADNAADGALADLDVAHIDALREGGFHVDAYAGADAYKALIRAAKSGDPYESEGVPSAFAEMDESDVDCFDFGD